MKKIYLIFLCLLSALILAWFLPWLYSIIFPSASNDPFLAFSPVNEQFIATDNLGEGKTDIFTLKPDGSRGETLTREERDSLLPQIYFTQLVAAEKLPDTIAGKEVSIPVLKHGQWVFSSHPRDLNKVMPEVHLIMESMPERIDLEDPDEVFTLNNKVEFIRISDGSVNENRSARFDRVFRDRGFNYPLRSSSANITTRKPRDEGYLLADDAGKVFHLKMQAGRPYMSAIALPQDERASEVFIMENGDPRELGFVAAESGALYLIEREEYKVTRLPIGEVYPRKEKLSIVRNIFNLVVKITDNEGVKWFALDSDDYSLLGSYSMKYEETPAQHVASYLFPVRLSFTSLNDGYARPRFHDWSARALWLGLLLSLTIVFISIKRGESKRYTFWAGLLTLAGGIYLFIPLLLFRD